MEDVKGSGGFQDIAGSLTPVAPLSGRNSSVSCSPKPIPQPQSLSGMGPGPSPLSVSLLRLLYKVTDGLCVCPEPGWEQNWGCGAAG